jgi:hypothetical protein
VVLNIDVKTEGVSLIHHVANITSHSDLSKRSYFENTCAKRDPETKELVPVDFKVEDCDGLIVDFKDEKSRISHSLMYGYQNWIILLILDHRVVSPSYLQGLFGIDNEPSLPELEIKALDR